MSNQVYANGMEVSCKQADGKSICCFPDVCMTPPQTPATPPGVPVPYPNTGMASDTTDGSSSVKISGQEVMLKNKSYFKKSTGDEAGSAPMKGVVTHKNTGKVYFTKWSMDVKVEGENVVRHLDLTTHNHGSTTNTAPWNHLDASAFKPGGACAKESSELKKAGCTDPVNKSPRKACCDCPQAQCVLVPYDKADEMCCKKGIEEGDHKTTGHHIVPVSAVSEVRSVRTKGRRLKGRRAQPLRGNAQYHENAAPTICVKGKDHDVRYANGDLMEHGLFGNAYCAERDHVLDVLKKPCDLDNISEAAAKAVEKETEGACTAKCVLAQSNQYHQGKVTNVRRDTLNPRPKSDRVPRGTSKAKKKSS